MTDERHLERAPCTIAYERQRAASDPDRGPAETVVLLHGFGMSRTSLRALTGLLFERGAATRALLPDARGHGASTEPERDDAFGYPAMRDDLCALLEREAPDGAHLVGHSMGGQIALLAALRAPALVRSLTVIAGGACRSITDPREQSAWRRAAASFEAATRAELCRALASAAPTDRPALDAETLYGAARGARLARVVRGAFLGVESNREACRTLRIPTLVIAGSRDEGWLEPSRELAGLVPGSALEVVEGAGHLVHLEEPERCADRIAAHLRAGRNAGPPAQGLATEAP